MAGSPPHTPFPPVTSSDPKTASPTLNVQIPLILLGRRDVKNDWDFGPGRQSNRLKIIHQALQEFCPDIDVALWVPGVSKEDGKASSRPVRHEEDRMQLRKIVDKRRAEWMEGERKRWVGFEERGGWVLRQTDRGGEAGSGVLSGWKEGDGLLTDVERGLMGDGIWACSFTLQRFNINMDEKELLELEMEKVTAVLEKINGVELPQIGTMFRIISSERCWPRITFQPGRRASQTGTTAWDERTVCNLLLLQTAFERELLTFPTPTFSFRYWPLSHFLTHRAVRDMQRLRKEKWKKLGQGSREGVGEKRKKKHWEREVSKWIEDLEWEDEKVEERERILGEGREAWWEALETRDMGTLVEQMDSRFKGGLAVNFQQEGKTENGGLAAATFDESSGEDTEDKPMHDSNVDNADLYAPSIPNLDETSLPPSPHPTPSFPRIKAISFPVPRFSASIPFALLLAYIELISKLILFAHQTTEETVRLHIHKLREINEQDDAQPLEQLNNLAKLLNISAPNLETINQALSPYYTRRPPPSSDHDRNTELERLLADSPVDDYNIESSSPFPPCQSNLEGKDEVFTSFVRHVEGFYRREREYVGRFVERYGRAGGFLVPRRREVFGLMVGVEGRRGDWREGREKGVVEGIGDELDG